MRLGVDIGGTGVKIGAVDDKFNIIYKISIPTEIGFENNVFNIYNAALKIADMLSLNISDFTSIGLGAPGCVNPITGNVVLANNINWKNVSLINELKKYVDIPIYIGNDANCAVAGETLAGAAKGYDNVVMLTLGTGVGGGIIYGGKLLLGGDGMGAELGHTPLVFGGIKCSCGINGCLESYASVTALIRMTKEASINHPESSINAWINENNMVSGRTAFECAKAGDPVAIQVVDTYEEYIANGIGGLISIFRPEIFIIGGGISNEGDYLIKPIRDKVIKYTFGADFMSVPNILKAELGNDAGIIGAAFLDLL